MNQPLASVNSIPETASDVAHARQTLLSQLETSLEASQQALLARDLPRLEQLTGEQNVLLRSLATLSTAPETSRAKTSVSEDPLLLKDPFVLKVRAAAARTLHLGRVQQALLDRAQRSLRALSRLIAGPQASYRPFADIEEIAVRANRNLSFGEE
jgi:flagellar biosynthesis/type III secretory pathway chaperone